MAIENLGSIVTLSLVLVGLASIPFLSHSVTISAIDNYDEGLGPILGEENLSATDAKYYPGNTSEKFGPEIFHYEASTAFGEFVVDITNSDALDVKERLTNNDVIFTAENINNGTPKEIWTLKTNNFTLVSEKYYSYAKETFTSPEGMCQKQINMGQVSETCSGQMGKIESEWEDAKDLMNEYSDKMKKAVESVDIPNIQSTQWKN